MSKLVNKQSTYYCAVDVEKPLFRSGTDLMVENKHSISEVLDAQSALQDEYTSEFVLKS